MRLSFVAAVLVVLGGWEMLSAIHVAWRSVAPGFGDLEDFTLCAMWHSLAALALWGAAGALVYAAWWRKRHPSQTATAGSSGNAA